VGGFGIWHWLIVIILVMLLFGKGRISDMMGDLGKGLKSFKAGMADEDELKRDAQQRLGDPQRQIPPQQPIDITPHAPRNVDPVAPPFAADPLSPQSPPPPRDDTAR
jgi:sec-independent protein translocase protein TatA